MTLHAVSLKLCSWNLGSSAGKDSYLRLEKAIGSQSRQFWLDKPTNSVCGSLIIIKAWQRFDLQAFNSRIGKTPAI